jgi:predicted  nucleic acid-binding Zn-ribbon protein
MQIMEWESSHAGCANCGHRYVEVYKIEGRDFEGRCPKCGKQLFGPVSSINFERDREPLAKA